VIPSFLHQRIQRVHLEPGQRVDYASTLPLCSECGDFIVMVVTFEPKADVVTPRRNFPSEYVCLGCGVLARSAAGAAPSAGTPAAALSGAL